MSYKSNHNQKQIMPTLQPVDKELLWELACCLPMRHDCGASADNMEILRQLTTTTPIPKEAHYNMKEVQ